MRCLGEEGAGDGAGQGGGRLTGEEYGTDPAEYRVGITRCMVVCGITSDIEPNMPMATAAGSAVVSDDEVNSRKYAAALAVSCPSAGFEAGPGPGAGG